MAFDLGGRIVLEEAFAGPLRQLIQMAAQGEDALHGLGQAGDDAMGNLGRAGGSGVDAFGAAMGLVGKATAVVGAGLAAVKVGEKVLEFGDLGAEALTVRDSFETLTAAVGVNANVLDQLQAVAGGTVGELDLMRLSNAALAGASGDLAQGIGNALPTLLEMARAASKLNPAMGDTSFMFQSLVTGIRRGSPMILDNLGLTIKLGEANDALAAQLGKSVDELSSEERTLAVLNAVLAEHSTLLEQAGGNLDKLSDGSVKLKTAWDELKLAFAEELAPTTSGIEGDLAQTLDVLRVALFGDEVEKVRVRIAELKNDIEATSNIPILNLQIPRLQRELSEAEAELARLEALAQIAQTGMADLDAVGLDTLSEEVRNARMEFVALTTATAMAGQSIAIPQQLIDSFVTGAITADQFTAQVDRLAGRIEAAAAGGDAASGPMYDLADAIALVGDTADAKAASIARLQAALSGVEADVAAATRRIASAGDDISEAAAAQMLDTVKRQLVALEAGKSQLTELEYQRRKAIITNSLNEELAAHQATATQIGRSYGSMVDDTTRKLQSLIEQELRPSFDLGDLTGGALGGGDEEQRIDEHYRRLAAIALRGGEELAAHSGDWADTIGLIPEDVKAQGIGAIQEWAKGMVEAYDKGLDFSLIDKDAIKQRILGQLQADQMRQEVVDDLLSELGGTVSLGQLQAAAGITATPEPGAMAGVDVAGMLGQADLGQLMTQGSDLATTVMDGFTETLSQAAPAAQVAGAWAADFAGSVEVFKAIGAGAGRELGGAFVEAVKSAAGNVRGELAMLIAPEVAAILAGPGGSLP